MTFLLSVDPGGDVESWRPVVGWEGFYEVSSHGRVRSIDRIHHSRAGYTQKYRGRMLRPNLTHGYWGVTLSRDTIPSTRKVHHLVLEAFVGPRPEGMEACHINGIRNDARLSNLRWGTHSSNTLDQVRHGTHAEARKTHCPRGHVYDLFYKRGRKCSVCKRANSQRYEARKREKCVS